jgi:hypothetical protein
MQENNQNHEPSILENLEHPSNKDLLSVITQINERTRAIEQTLKSQASAFVINDLGTPDYDGHRKSHIKLENEAKLVESYKNNVSETIIKWAVTGILILLAVGASETLRSWMASG